MTENDSKNTSEAKVPTSLDAHIEEAGKADRIKIPNEMPVLPVRDTVVFPSMVAASSVSTERDLKLLNHVWPETGSWRSWLKKIKSQSCKTI